MTNYTILVHCSNCNFSGCQTLRKGLAVSSAECPVCGCRNLELQPKSASNTWTTTTKKVTMELDKKFDKLNELFDNIGKGLDDLFK